MSAGDWLTVDGVRLEAVWHGPRPGEAPTLVFLHEGLGCVALWRDFPARLAEATGCGALAYSRRGYGRSAPCDLPRPVSYMHHEGQVVLPALLEAAGIGDCILVGHSDGGTIALLYAGGTAATPLRGIIAEAAHVVCEPVTLRSIEAAGRAYAHGGLRTRLARYHGDNVDCAFLGWHGAWLHPDFEQWDVRSCLPDIAAPVLAIQGEDDPYGTAAQVDAIVAGAGAGARILMLPDCGHCPHGEQPDATLDAMARFIARLLDKRG